MNYVRRFRLYIGEWVAAFGLLLFFWAAAPELRQRLTKALRSEFGDDVCPRDGGR